jgi:CHAD domain-containing protein
VSEGLGGHEHVHQARIGIRRIRTVLREFADAVPSIDPSWNVRLATTFADLGALRDREVVLAEWTAILDRQGAPAFTVPVAHDVDPRDILRRPDFSLLLIDLLEFAYGEPNPTSTPCGDAISTVLRGLHRQVRRRAKKFATASVEYRHATRKTVKRLRYIAELSASLYPPRKVKRFLSTVAPAQERLGELNDLLVAAEMYQSLTDRHGQAWFAVGWLKARERAAVKRSVTPLQRVADAEPFWQ